MTAASPCAICGRNDAACCDHEPRCPECRHYEWEHTVWDEPNGTRKQGCRSICRFGCKRVFGADLKLVESLGAALSKLEEQMSAGAWKLYPLRSRSDD